MTFENPEDQKQEEIFAEIIAGKYGGVTEPLKEALERFETGYEKLYAPLRPLLDYYNELLMQYYDYQDLKLGEELRKIQPVLSDLVKRVDKEGETYRGEIKAAKEELDRLRRLYFPSREDISKN
ncbi:MAG TPA: hypothetical protein VFA52_02330 [Candidatus Paceibacterota bacterium]|nr:hypothetical protein [Candidatus Paceibacterota bacterium]